MKKLLALALTAVMTFSLAACGSTPAAENTGDGRRLQSFPALQAWMTVLLIRTSTPAL